MPEMQEHFPAVPPGMADMPEMQEHFPAEPWMADMPETQEHFPAPLALLGALAETPQVFARVRRIRADT